MMGLLDLLFNRKLLGTLILFACVWILLPYLTMWMHTLLTKEETALPLYTSVFRFSREGEEPVFKVGKLVRRSGHSGLLFDLDVRGRFSSMEIETDRYDEDWDNQLSRMEETRRKFRGRICSLHSDMLASRLIHPNESAWIVDQPVSADDFGKMTDPERKEFKEQLLTTVVYSAKIRILNEPVCGIEQGILNPPNSSGNAYESILTKAVPTKNGTYLIFQKTIQVTRNPQFQCTEKRQYSVVHQVLRTAMLPDKSSYWFSWFSGLDLTMLPGIRCHMDNQVIQDLDYNTFPPTVLSTLFCF